MEPLLCIMKILDELNEGEGVNEKQESSQFINHAWCWRNLLAQWLDIVFEASQAWWEKHLVLKVMQLERNAVILPDL